MKKVNDIIIGSGVSGITLALLLAKQNRKVLLIERNPKIGGALRRFQRLGNYWDTGFHFTGGILPKEPLNQMLQILDIDKCLSTQKTNIKRKYYFEHNNSSFELPTGIKEYFFNLKEHFPKETEGLDQYCQYFIKTVDKSKVLDVRNLIYNQFEFLPEDNISLKTTLNQYIKDPLLKAILSSDCFCYGVPPSQISFANHARMAYFLVNSLSRLKKGGDSIFEPLNEKLYQTGVEIQTNVSPVTFLEVQEKNARKLLLSNQEEICFDHCIFTIHPKEALKVIPMEHFSPAFQNRVSAFDPSNGFFTLYGHLGKTQGCDNEVTYIFKDENIDQLLKETYSGPGGICLIKDTPVSEETSLFTAMETIPVSTTQKWNLTNKGARPVQYEKFKEERAIQLLNRIRNFAPDDDFQLLFSATPLTYHNYLNNYDGSAYGIRQKMGQFNLLGRLKIRNILICGQSSMLPGIMGAMLSSFIIASHLLGKDNFGTFINERLK